MPEGIDPAEWEGLWVHEESFGIDAMVAVVKVASRDEARLEIAWLEPDGDEAKLSKWNGVLRELNDGLFLNVRFENDATRSTRYYWARVENDDDVVRAWIPAHDVFKRLVTEGIFPGEIDGDEYEVTLNNLNADHLRLLSSNTLPTVPVIFRRIGK
jgi:hypothetical protein